MLCVAVRAHQRSASVPSVLPSDLFDRTPARLGRIINHTVPQTCEKPSNATQTNCDLHEHHIPSATHRYTSHAGAQPHDETLTSARKAETHHLLRHAGTMHIVGVGVRFKTHDARVVDKGCYHLCSKEGFDPHAATVYVAPPTRPLTIMTITLNTFGNNNVKSERFDPTSRSNPHDCAWPPRMYKAIALNNASIRESRCFGWQHFNGSA